MMFEETIPTGIQTIGPALAKGLSAVAEGRRLTDKLDGVIKHRSSRETTMVGRGASLDGRLFLGGTDGSNSVPSSGESGELPYSAAGSSRSRRQCANEETSTAGRMALWPMSCSMPAASVRFCS